jgi:hypothetical protein
VGKSTIVKQVKATAPGNNVDNEKKNAVLGLIKSLVSMTLDMSAELCDAMDAETEVPPPPSSSLSLSPSGPLKIMKRAVYLNRLNLYNPNILCTRYKRPVALIFLI